MRRLVLSFLVCCLFQVEALYEDQLGKLDWYRRGIGIPHAASLHPRKPRLLAATDSHVLTHLHLREGGVQWRQKLEGPISHLFVSHRENAVFTVSAAAATTLRAWSQADGTLRWERHYSAPLRAVEFLESDSPKLLTLMGTELELRSVQDTTLWTTSVGPLSGCEGRQYFTTGAAQITLVSHCGDRLLLTTFTEASGKDFFTREYSIDVDSDVTSAARMEDTILLTTNAHICLLDLTGAPDRCRAPQIWHLAASKEVPCHRSTAQWALFRSKLLSINDVTGSAEIQKLQQHQLTTLFTISDYALHSTVMEGPEHEAVAILTGTSTTGWGLEVYDMGLGERVHSESAPQLPTDFQPQHLFLGTYTRKNATMGYRFLLVGRYGELYMMQQGQLVWERNEVVSGVKAALFVDPPMHSQHIQADPMKWIQAQFLTLKVQFQLGKARDLAQLAELREDLSGKRLALKDASGYRKFILCLTRYDSLIALHNGDGRVLWHTKFPGSPSFEGLALWSYAHSEAASPRVLVYKTGEMGSYAVVDAHSGEILESQSEIPCHKILKLPQTSKQGATEQSLFLLLDLSNPEAPVGTLLPPVDPPEELQGVVFWEVERDQGLAKGYRVHSIDSETHRANFHPNWRLSFHAKVLSVSERGIDDPVHSHTKVLGDRSLLFKYLNPNTALIITGGGMEFDDAYIEAFLIDTVTGRVLFRQLHESAKGPVHSVISQHWAIYHYWSISNQRFQMSTLEMYDASHRPLTVSDLLLSSSDQEKISSYDPIPVKVYNATFFVPTGVTSLTVTKTQKGITTQLLLLGTVSDQIYAMNKKFLDPRRPIRPTPNTKEERLIPYSENLPLIPTHYITYSYEIRGLRDVICAAAGLESGAHLFAFGDDLFYTRLQPEHGFDTLDEDFNYGFLLLTLLAMFIASVVCHYLVRDAKLARKWK